MLAPPAVRVFTSMVVGVEVLVRQRSRVELFEQIRRDQRVDPGVSVRELARAHGVHRRTVRQALASAVPPPRRQYPVRARPLDPWREVINGWLIADQEVPRKQRHTARRVWQRLVAEHGAQVAEVTVSRYVATRRVELGLVDREVFIPQVHAPGAEAEVDFGEFEIVIARHGRDGVDVRVRLCHSGRAFHVAYGTQAQEAFLQGHVEAFDHFGGVPGRGPVRQLEAGGDPCLEGPRPDRGRPVHRLAVALRVRLVLLHAGPAGRAREGRRRGRDRPVPSPPSGAGADRCLVGRAEPAHRRWRCRRRRPG